MSPWKDNARTPTVRMNSKTPMYVCTLYVQIVYLTLSGILLDTGLKTGMPLSVSSARSRMK